MNQTTGEPAEEHPPVFKKWKHLYWFVLANQALAVVVFYIITKVFE
jgi:hypothetical protein